MCYLCQTNVKYKNAKTDHLQTVFSSLQQEPCWKVGFASLPSSLHTVAVYSADYITFVLQTNYTKALQ